ncbi:hypothetical protein QAD02_021414 [Eretmocerus hayati]|uniref:Uncharacterized protein n=1 Tax=Eretmocerus hayati TaxID=131215 RepID=A0ACC2PRP3_9HYME|nr:hypothetical protein QAD02_021414 [Eretmocerus hayati]
MAPKRLQYLYKENVPIPRQVIPSIRKGIGDHNPSLWKDNCTNHQVLFNHFHPTPKDHQDADTNMNLGVTGGQKQSGDGFDAADVVMEELSNTPMEVVEPLNQQSVQVDAENICDYNNSIEALGTSPEEVSKSISIVSLTLLSSIFVLIMTH